MERIEVLRGPQGTLFGKNTTGGAINIITNRPQPEFGGDVLLRTGSHNRRDARIIVNAPLTDTVYTRVAVGHDENDGYYKNVLLDENRSDLNTTSAKVSARWVPTDQWTFDLTGEIFLQANNQFGGDCRFLNVTALQTLFHEDQGGGNFEQACRESEEAGRYRFFSNLDSFVDVEQYSTVFEADWSSAGAVGFLDDLAISTNLGWRQLNYAFQYDRTYSRELFDNMISIGDDMQGADYYNAEIIFEAQKGRSDFLFGYNYFRESAWVGDDDRCFEAYSDVAGTGQTVECIGVKHLEFILTPFNQLPFGPAPFGLIEDSEVDSHGVFAHGTFEVTPRVGLEAGVRWTRETRFFENIGWSLTRGAGGFENVLNDETVAPFGTDKETWSKVTPMTSLKFNLPESRGPFDSGLLYLLWARGFNSGGFNIELDLRSSPALSELSTFEPETVDNFEFGIKASLFQRLQFNFAVFLMQFDDKQETVTIDNTDGRFGTDPAFQITQNAAEADIKGFELEFIIEPFEGFQFDGGLSLQDAEFSKFQSFNPDTGETEDLSDRRVNQLPEWQFTGNAQYTHMLPNDSSIRARLGAYYQSENDLQTLTFEAPPSVCFVDEYWKFNSRIDWTNSSKKFNVAIFGKNLTGEDVLRECGFNTGRGIWRPIFEDQFTWGLEGSYQF